MGAETGFVQAVKPNKQSALAALQNWWSRNRVAYFFIAPALLVIVAVSFYPVGFAVIQSLYRSEYAQATEFVGFANFLEVFQDPQLPGHVAVSGAFVGGSLILAIPIGMALAVILNRPLRGLALFRSILILPWAVSQVAAALIWGWILNAQYGPLNYFFEVMGLGRIDIIGSTALAMPAVIAANVWRTYPYAMVLFLAALQGIPHDILDAAKVDGASSWRTFWSVVVPMIRNTIMNVLIVLSLTYLNTVTIIFILTGGGPVGTTDTLALRTFREGIVFWNTSYAAALGILIFLLNIVVSLLYIKTLKVEAYV